MAPARRLSVGFLGCLAAVDVAAISYGHRHLHRNPAPAMVTEVVTVPVKLYEYHGAMITETEACEGINNGTLHWAPGSHNVPKCELFKEPVLTSASAPEMATSPSVPVKHAPISIVTSSKVVAQSAKHSVSDISTVVSQSSKHSTATFSTVTVPSTQHSASSSIIPTKPTRAWTDPIEPLPTWGFHQENDNVQMDFPDGELECSEFPLAYGAIAIPWMGMGGWSGIQHANIANDLVVGLATGVHGDFCAETEDDSITFCSYACPPGYQKSQWPATQGGSAMAVSVGGLKCVNGKLHLTNPDLSSKLCIPGTGKSFISNQLVGSASICRTDYPGTEDETVPLETLSGLIYPLTCPDAATYYQHLGAQTSAQYYVNNEGVPVEDACQWGHDGVSRGNWAPVVIGAETDTSGATWLSIMTSRQNDPTNYQELDFSIELVGDFGGSACFYTQHNHTGYYCSSGTLANFSPSQASCKTFDPAAGVTVPGCTVQLFSGTATYNFVETQS